MEIYDLLTCADNEAVTYFRKQGFNKHEILINPSRWVGCIKDYDGITLVHCKIRPDVDYLHFPKCLRKQQIIFEQKTGVILTANQHNPLFSLNSPIKSNTSTSNSSKSKSKAKSQKSNDSDSDRNDSIDKMEEIMRKLTPKFAAFPQAPSFVNVSIPEILDSYKPSSYLIPNTGRNSSSKKKKEKNSDNNDEEAPDCASSETSTKKVILHTSQMTAYAKKKFVDEYYRKMETFRNKFISILNELKSDSFFSVVFSRPVTEEIAPSYFTLIKKPIDFWTIEKRLTRFPDYYKRPEVFASDINLMCENCKKFNTPDTNYYKAAVDLMKKFRQLYDEEFPEFPLQIP